MLDEQRSMAPSPTVARHAVLARVLTGRAQEVPTLFNALPLNSHDPAILREAQYLAHMRGDVASAAQIGEQLLSMIPPGSDVWVMYNTACSWARAGDIERSIGWLKNAIDFGWSDLQTLSSDHDLAPLWNDSRFHSLRTRLGAV